MKQIAHENTREYDWLEESVIRKDGTGIAVTTGTNGSNERVFFISEFENSGLDPIDREYAIIRVENDIEDALQIARKGARGEKIESNIVETE